MPEVEAYVGEWTDDDGYTYYDNGEKNWIKCSDCSGWMSINKVGDANAYKCDEKCALESKKGKHFIVYLEKGQTVTDRSTGKTVTITQSQKECLTNHESKYYYCQADYCVQEVEKGGSRKYGSGSKPTWVGDKHMHKGCVDGYIKRQDDCAICGDIFEKTKVCPKCKKNIGIYCYTKKLGLRHECFVEQPCGFCKEEVGIRYCGGCKKWYCLKEQCGLGKHPHAGGNPSGGNPSGGNPGGGNPGSDSTTTWPPEGTRLDFLSEGMCEQVDNQLSGNHTRDGNSIYITEGSKNAVTKLVFDSISDFTPGDILTFFPNLTDLTIRNCGFTNVSGITNLTNLQTLNLESNNIQNIDKLSTLTKLQTVYLRYNNITNFSGVSHVANKQIDRQGLCQEIDCAGDATFHYAMVTNLANAGTSASGDSLIYHDDGNKIYIYQSEANLVKRLSLNGTANLENVGNRIWMFSQLEELDVSNNPKMTSIAGFENLNNLKTLKMDNCNISDISPLAACTKLETLSFKYNNVLNIKPLDGLTLKECDKRFNGEPKPIEVADAAVNFEPLKNALVNYLNTEKAEYASQNGKLIVFESEIRDIKEVDLKNTKVNNNVLATLANNFPNLERLEVQKTEITSLENLKSCKNLKALNASNNTIVSLSGLENLILKDLKLHNLDLPDVILKRNTSGAYTEEKDEIMDTAEIPTIVKDIMSGKYNHVWINKEIINCTNCQITENTVEDSENITGDKTYIDFEETSPLKGTKINVIKLMNGLNITLEGVTKAGKIQVGDINFNGTIDLEDAQLSLKNALKIELTFDKQEKEDILNIAEYVKDIEIKIDETKFALKVEDYIKILWIQKFKNGMASRYSQQEFNAFYKTLIDINGDNKIDNLLEETQLLLKQALGISEKNEDGTEIDTDNWVGTGELLEFKESVNDKNTTNKNVKYSVKNGYTLEGEELEAKNMTLDDGGKITSIKVAENNIFTVESFEMGYIPGKLIGDEEDKSSLPVLIILEGTSTRTDLKGKKIKAFVRVGEGNIQKNNDGKYKLQEKTDNSPGDYCLTSDFTGEGFNIGFEYYTEKDPNQIIKVNDDGSLKVIGDGGDIVTIVATPEDAERFNSNELFKKTYGNYKENGSLKVMSQVTVKVIKYADFISISGIRDGEDAITGDIITYSEELAHTGDVNMDGLVTTYDARLALSAALKIAPFEKNEEIKIADMDKDGKITLTDAQSILKKAKASQYILRKEDYVRSSEDAQLRDELDPTATLRDTSWKSDNEDILKIDKTTIYTEDNPPKIDETNATISVVGESGKSIVTATSEDGCVSDEIAFYVADLEITNNAPRPGQWTNKDVTVTITATGNVTGGKITGIYKKSEYDALNVNNNLIGSYFTVGTSEEGETFTHTYTEEKSCDELVFVYTFTDPNSGKEKEIVKTHKVDLTEVIDKTAPKCKVTYNTRIKEDTEHQNSKDYKTNYEVNAIITTTNGDTIDTKFSETNVGWERLDATSIEKTYTDNTVQIVLDENGNNQAKVIPEKVAIKDLAGNETIVEVTIDNIDNKGPIVQADVMPELYEKIDGCISEIGMILKVVEDDDKREFSPAESVEHVIIYKDGEEITSKIEKTSDGAYRIMEEGFYKIKAADEMGNISETNFIIYETVGPNQKINVTKAAQLEVISKMSQAGQTFEGYTIQIREDIDLSEICGNKIGNWVPIGSKETPFAGTFAGKFHTISGLYINNSGEDYQGLFGYVTGTIKNVAVSGTVEGRSYVGGIVGYYENSNKKTENIHHCKNSVKVTGNAYVGGIVGYINSDETVANVNNCTNVGAITSTKNYVGGIVGYSRNVSYAYIVNNASIAILNDSGRAGLIGRIDCYNNAKEIKIEYYWTTRNNGEDRKNIASNEPGGDGLDVNWDIYVDCVESTWGVSSNWWIDGSAWCEDTISPTITLSKTQDTNGQRRYSIEAYIDDDSEIEQYLDEEKTEVQKLSFMLQKGNITKNYTAEINFEKEIAYIEFGDDLESGDYTLYINDGLKDEKGNSSKAITAGPFRICKEKWNITAWESQTEYAQDSIVKVKLTAKNDYAIDLKNEKIICVLKMVTVKEDENGNLVTDEEGKYVIESETEIIRNVVDMSKVKISTNAKGEQEYIIDEFFRVGSNGYYFVEVYDSYEEIISTYAGNPAEVKYVDTTEPSAEEISIDKQDLTVNLQLNALDDLSGIQTVAVYDAEAVIKENTEEAENFAPEKIEETGRIGVVYEREACKTEIDYTIEEVQSLDAYVLKVRDHAMNVSYTPNIYKVELNTNKGTLVEGVDISGYVEGDTIQLPTVDEISRNGCEFGGWYDNSSFAGSPVTEISSTDTGAKQYYAKWIGITHSVTFVNENGSTIKSVNFLEGDTQLNENDIPEVPEKEGHTGEWSSITLGTEDLTVRPIYTAIEYTATFTNEDGSTYKQVKFTVDDETIDEPAVPEKDGQTGRWSDYEIRAENITIWPIYDDNSYNVTLKSNGGTLKKDIKVYTFGETTQLPTADEISRTGYEFAGWYTNEACTGQPVTEIVSTETGAKTYYAKWNAIQYVATFVDDGGRTEVPFTVETEQIQAPTNITERPGYIATWPTYAVEPNNITIYAQYVVREYIASFKAGDIVIPVAFTVEDKGQIQIPEVPQKDGYEGRWADFELGTDNITIEAIYTPITYVATFVADGEVVAEVEFTVENKDQIEIPEVPQKEGYEGKWKEYELGIGDVTIEAEYTVINDRVTVNTGEGSPITDTKETDTTKYLIVSDKTTAKGVLDNLESDYTLSVKDENNQEIDIESQVKTNDKVFLNDTEEEYIIVVKGDVTRDGKVDMRDMLKLNRYRLGKTDLTEPEFIAGNVINIVNEDENITMGDILKINKYRLEKIDSL